MAKALITWGGWDGHQPDKVAALFATELRAAGMEVTVTDTLACFDDPAALTDLALIVPVWTMSSIEKHQSENVAAAVEAGVGLAGCHGGMCDSFRNDVLWQFMTGAQWVAHPGNDGVRYRVRITSDDPLVADWLQDAAKAENLKLTVVVDVYAGLTRHGIEGGQPGQCQRAANCPKTPGRTGSQGDRPAGHAAHAVAPHALLFGRRPPGLSDPGRPRRRDRLHA